MMAITTSSDGSLRVPGDAVPAVAPPTMASSSVAEIDVLHGRWRTDGEGSG